MPYIVMHYMPEVWRARSSPWPALRIPSSCARSVLLLGNTLWQMLPEPFENEMTAVIHVLKSQVGGPTYEHAAVVGMQ